MLTATVMLALLAAPRTLADAFARLPARHGETLEAGPGKTVTVDEKNGWLHIEQRRGAEVIDTTFAVFVTRAKERVYGYRFLHRGKKLDDQRWPPTTDVLAWGFYRERDGTWEEVSGEVLPVSLTDVWPDEFVAPRECTGTDLELPRKGTTVVVRAPKTSACFPGSTEGGDEEARWLSGIEARALRFRWDARAGQFVKE